MLTSTVQQGPNDQRDRGDPQPHPLVLGPDNRRVDDMIPTIPDENWHVDMQSRTIVCYGRPT